jgi:hypothetical protein
MAAAGALNTDVILTDPQTGFTFLLLNLANRVVDITNVIDPAAGLTYILKLVRNGREVRRWAASMFITTVNVHVGFPVDVDPGQIQFIGQQTLGALTAQKYNVTFATDL